MKPYLLLNLPLPEHRRCFKAAANEIVLLLEGTKAVMVLFQQTPIGPTPVEIAEINETDDTHDATDGAILFVGYVEGPEQDGGNLNVENTWWGEQVLLLMKENGLQKQVDEEVN